MHAAIPNLITDHFHFRLKRFGKKTKSFTTARKNIVKLIKFPSLVAKCCAKYALAKFANSVYFCSMQGKALPHWPKFTGNGFSVRNTKIYKICKLYKRMFASDVRQ